ncbi:retrovirus-related pol polyprotein from transposon TNT 1-94 [Tanacetum coccineum]
MVVVNNVPQLVDKRGGSYAAIPKTVEGDDKPESQWTPDERRVIVQDQRLKSIIMSCLPDDIMESVISCETAKATWSDLVYSFEGPSDTKENRIMELKLEYQTFRAKPIESLSQTYTRYKTLLNDGVNLSKHEINALITTLSSTIISTAFFSNNVIQDFQENSDDEVDERSSEEYLRDLDIAFHDRALLANSKRFIKRRNNFSSQKANENTECYNVAKKADPKVQKDYKAEYKKMKAKLALLEASPFTSQTPKSFQPKNQGLVAEIFDWDEEEVSNDKEVTQVKVQMALADDELTVRKNHARNGELIEITMRKVNILLSMDEDADWQNYLKYINIDLKFVEEQRLNLLSKYNKIVFELNKCRDELLVLKHAKLDAGASPSSEVMPLTFQPHSSKERSGLGTVTVSETEPTTPSVPTEVKDTEQESKINELTKLVQMLIDEKILKAKAKPFPPCTHCGFNDHRPDDCRNYPECEIYGSYDHFTSGHNHVIHIKGGVLAESSQSSESSIGVKCNTCGSTVHFTIDHNKFDHFKRETHQGAHLVPRQWMLKEYYWCQELSTQICRATRKCLHLLHMDLFGPVSLMSINHEKYTLVIVDEYSSLSDEKEISHNFSSPYTPEQNGVAEKKNRTLIKAARTMLNRSVLSKHF